MRLLNGNSKSRHHFEEVYLKRVQEPVLGRHVESMFCHLLFVRLLENYLISLILYPNGDDTNKGAYRKALVEACL